MIKVVTLLFKRPDLSAEEFRDYYELIFQQHQIVLILFIDLKLAKFFILKILAHSQLDLLVSHGMRYLRIF